MSVFDPKRTLLRPAPANPIGKSIQARRNYRLLPPFVCQSLELTAVEAPMNGIIYIIGLIVVIMAILSFLGLR
jgi:hypothetical protein